MREVEIKIKLNKLEKELLTKWLQEKAEYVKEEHHIEHYLDNPNNTTLFKTKKGYLDAKDYLRVRMTDKGDSICLKRFDIDEDGKSKNIAEHETLVADGNEALRLFKAMGYKDDTIIDKVRQKYENDEYEIVLDEVKDLGSFAEVELKSFPDDLDIKIGFERIRNFLKLLGFKKIKECKRGYVSMLWNPDYNFIEERDL